MRNRLALDGVGGRPEAEKRKTRGTGDAVWSGSSGFAFVSGGSRDYVAKWRYATNLKKLGTRDGE